MYQLRQVSATPKSSSSAFRKTAISLYTKAGISTAENSLAFALCCFLTWSFVCESRFIISTKGISTLFYHFELGKGLLLAYFGLGSACGKVVSV